MFLTRNYGDICCFRIGIYKGYLLNHPDYFQHVLKSKHHDYNKQNYNYRMLKPVLGEGLITSDGDQWLRHRRLIQPAFHREKIHRFTSVVVDATQRMLERWASQASPEQPIDMDKEMMKLTFHIITRSLFSADLRDASDIVRRAFGVLNRDIAYRLTNVFVPPLWVPTPRNRAFKTARDDLNRVVYTIIERRRKKGEYRDDLLQMLLNAQDADSGYRMTDKEVRDEVMTLVLAGHETTANLLAWTCYLLSQHPDAAHRMHEELNAVFSGAEPVVNDLSSLRYTDSVIQEALRLYPPVWIISRKAIDRDVIGGYTIPAGSVVTLCSYALHRHPDFWDDPDSFFPERFLIQDRELSKAYFPFGGGPRSCIGAPLAMMEARLILAMIFSKYRLTLRPGHPVEPEPLVTLRPRYGLKMTLEEW